MPVSATAENVVETNRKLTQNRDANSNRMHVLSYSKQGWTKTIIKARVVHEAKQKTLNDLTSNPKLASSRAIVQA